VVEVSKLDLPLLGEVMATELTNVEVPNVKRVLPGGSQQQDI